MYRVKVALIAGLVVVAATAAAFTFANMTLLQRMAQRSETDVRRAQTELLRSARLDGFELAGQAAAFAREDELVQIFAKGTDGDKEKAAYVAVEVRKARLEKKDESRKEEPAKVGIIGVVDAEGRLLARDLQPTWRLLDDLKKDFPSLDVALKGQPNKDIWNLDGSMVRVGAAPIRGPQGNVLGAIFIGYVQSTRDAMAQRDVLGTEVAFFLDGKIHASSFQRSGDTSSSESAEEKALAAQLFDGPKLAEQAIAARQATELFKVKIGAMEWLAAAAPLPGNATPSKSGFVVLQSLAGGQKEAGPIGGVILGIGLIALLAVLGAAAATARRFLLPLDKVEAGVSEVINGNHEYVFESPSRDYEGLANGLNVMLARLLGRPDPDDEEAQGEPDDKEGTAGVE